MASAKTPKTTPEQTTFTPEGGEQWLIDALLAERPCVFRYKGENKEPEAARTIRGDILSKILRSVPLHKGGDPIPLPRAVSIIGAIITGYFDMSDTDTGLALGIGYSEFENSINFTHAKFTQLSFKHSDLAGAQMEHLETQGNLCLDDIHNKGPLELAAAKIGGQLTAIAAARQTCLINPNGDAINAQGAKIADSVFLDGTHIEGTAAFNHADIGGQFSASSLEEHVTRLIKPTGRAINAQGTKIAGEVFLRGAHIEGTADFNSADVGGQFAASSLEKHITRFITPNGRAIHAQGVKIAGSVFLRDVHIVGTADFNSAEINGQFAANGASLIMIIGRALHLQNTNIKGLTWLADMPHPPIGAMDFTDTEMASIVIDDHSTPLGRLFLDGTRYNSLFQVGGGAHTTCAGWLAPQDGLSGKRYRLAFDALFENHEKFPSLANAADTHDAIIGLLKDKIAEQKSYHHPPFVYRQFSKVLESNGHKRQAARVRIEERKARIRNSQNFAERIKFWAQNQFELFGTNFLTTTAIISSFWFIGYLIFGVHAFQMTPASENYFMMARNEACSTSLEDKENCLNASNYRLGDQLPQGYPEFNPLFYTLDISLPFIDLDQEDYWRPKSSGYNKITVLRVFSSIYQILGWLLFSLLGLRLVKYLNDSVSFDSREP